jgi:ketosteroid isomerase-like protein
MLEGCLRSLSNEVVRQGSQITLLGLGPSPRAVNRRDTTVIDVKREDGATVIHADVRFQASAVLGMAAQDVVVKEKLDRIFDDVLARLGLSARTSQSEKVDDAAAVADGVERPAASSAEPVAQEVSAKTPAADPVVPETASDDPPAANAMPEPAAEPGSEVEPAESDIPAATTVAASEPIPEPPAAELLPEQVVSAPAAEPVASPQIAANESEEPVAVLEEKNSGEEKLPETPGAIPAPEMKQADAAEVSAVAKADSAVNVDAPKLDAAAETVTATPEAFKAVEGKEEASAKAADVAPVPTAESAKPLSATIAALSTKPEKFAESSKAAEENKPAPSVNKPEAISRNALRSASSPQRDSSVVKPPKPAKPQTAAVAKASLQPVPPERAKEMFGGSTLDDEPETNSKWLKWSAWVAAFIVLVVAPLVWLYMPSHPESAAPVSQPVPAAVPVPAPQPPVLAKQPGDDPDPAMVVSDWEAAMNSSDAAAQAAFYADPVERYFLRHNLSRDEVKADKQSAINRRKGDWSVKMENVKVTRPDDNTAKARLIKHYTVKEDGKTASEWFVPSLLQMTRANGRWQITSERDLGWATSLDELGY